MAGPNHPADFEHEILPHLDSAYNLARWLTHDAQDAQDVVQEAYLRAFRFFAQFRGGSARPWLLSIVRNTCYTWLQRNRPRFPVTQFEENLYGPDLRSPDPEEILLHNDASSTLRNALKTLPHNLREVLVLRELEGLSYREIAEATGTSPGTVMSRLSRARDRLRSSLSNEAAAHGLSISVAVEKGDSRAS